MELLFEGVSKVYPTGVRALEDFSCRLGPGVLGLLGPNGAGKTTVMNILSTLARPSTGRVLLDGVDIHSHPETIRPFLGYLPQEFGVYPNLTGFEFLEYLAAVKGLDRTLARKRIAELLEWLNLASVARQPLYSFSGGMKQRVGIAQALLNDPKVLIVDEPTVGLDPEERVRFRTLLSSLAGDRIVVLSTHIVSDVEAVATEIAILCKGRLVTYSSPETLLSSVQGKAWEMTVPGADLLEARERWLVSSALRRTNGVRLRILSDTAPAADAQPSAPTLEDAYIFWVSSRSERVPQ